MAFGDLTLVDPSLEMTGLRFEIVGVRGPDSLPNGQEALPVIAYPTAPRSIRPRVAGWTVGS